MESLIERLLSLLSERGPAVIDVNGVPHLITPNEMTAKPLPELLEREHPQFVKRAFVAYDVRGLIDYINTYKGGDDTPSRIYSSAPSAPGLKCWLTDHQPDQPEHLHHSAAYACPTTQSWAAWHGNNKKPLGQIAFAEFIEAQQLDIHEPDGASLLESVLQFRDAGTAEFRSAVRLSDGRVQFTYAQKEDAGQVRFPESLTLGLPVFEGMTTLYKLKARLRYRIKDGDLSLWWELDRPDLVLRAAYDELISHVETATDVHVYRGA